MEYTWKDIQNMTDEEVAELNKKLGVQVMKRYALFMIAKWALIFGAIHAVKKWAESQEA